MLNQHAFAASPEATCGQYRRAAGLFVGDEANGGHQGQMVAVPIGQKRKSHMGDQTRLQQHAPQDKAPGVSTMSQICNLDYPT